MKQASSVFTQVVVRLDFFALFASLRELFFVRVRFHLLLIALASLLTACISPQESGVKVIVGAKLGAIDYSVVVIAGGKFQAVGTQAATPVPKGSETIRGLGMTIEPLPGGPLIEPGQPADLLLRGPTETRTMRHGDWVK